MNSYKVIFDTNFICNDSSIKSFLGNREELEKFEKLSQIIIPDLVLEELKNRKIKRINEQKEYISKTIFNKNCIQNFDINKFILNLEKEEIIQYKTIRLENSVQILDKMREMAINNKPPFYKDDKGFKDTYIFFTIKHYIYSINEESKIFFITKDKKFISALENEPRITLAKNYQDFLNNIIKKYQTEYFIEYASKKLNFNINKDDFDSFYTNKFDNDILLIKHQSKKYFLLIENNEIIKYTDYNFEEKIDALKESSTFKETHNLIYELSGYIDYFSKENISQLKKSKEENIQINWISNDHDVKQFYANISI